MKKINVIVPLLLTLMGCGSNDENSNDHCSCAIPENIDVKIEKERRNSDQKNEVGVKGDVEAVIKKAVDAKISVSGSYSNSNSKIEEVYREIIGSNPQISQKANLYRSVACAYYEIACQDKTLSDKEKNHRLNEVVAVYEQNIHKVINEEKTTQTKEKSTQPSEINANSNAVPVQTEKKNSEAKTKEAYATRIEKIENKGNLSIGQTGGTVNQTTIVNPQEKFSEVEKREIIRNINLKYKAVGQNGATCIQLIPNSYRSESHQLCDDLELFLKEQGYQIVPNTNIINWGKTEDRVTYRVSEKSCMSLVISY